MHVEQQQQQTDKVYDLYHSEVGKHALLTPKEERVLLRRYHCCPRCDRRIPPRTPATNCPDCGAVSPPKVGEKHHVCTWCTKVYSQVTNSRICPDCGSGRDIEARQDLIRANLRFVIRRAKKFTLDPEVLHTLISAGNIGLMQAVDRFDISTNHRFLTYAEWWIRKEIMDELNNSSIIRVPTHKQKTLRRISKEGQYVCIHCGIRTNSEHNVRHLPVCKDKGGHVLEIPLLRDSQVLSDTLCIDDTVCVASENVETHCSTVEMKTLLRTVVDRMRLGERDRFIVVGYFDAVSADRKSDPKKLPQLAAIAGITPERVRQVKERLLFRLKRELQRSAITTAASLLPGDVS